MISEQSRIRCTICDEEMDWTEDNFGSERVKDGRKVLRRQCKPCRRKRSREAVHRYRETHKGLEDSTRRKVQTAEEEQSTGNAFHMEGEEEYVSTVTVAKQLGINRKLVEDDLLVKEVVPSKVIGSRRFIRKEDAEVYIHIRETVARSITLAEMSRRVSKKSDVVIEHLKRDKWPVPIKINNSALRGTWYILEEEAREYCRRKGWRYTIDGEHYEAESEKTSRLQREALLSLRKTVQTIGTVDQCGSCGTSRGVSGDGDTSTATVYGYLCLRCKKAARECLWDAERASNIAGYLAKRQHLQK